MSSFDGRKANEESIPVIQHYEGFGELVTGGSDVLKVLTTALCMLDDPRVNQYLLDCKLKLSDRITKTKIFPRKGMSLPDGMTYEEEESK
jgi:hypothetical protein